MYADEVDMARWRIWGFQSGADDDTALLILAFDQPLMHKFLFYNKFIIFLYTFRELLCSSSGGQIVLYSIWYGHTV